MREKIICFSMDDRKWIGFDMDECLGHFITLSVFPQIQTWLGAFRVFHDTTDEFNSEFTKRIVKKLAKYEREGITCLLRPGLIESLKHIHTDNVFILSNNSCHLLIEWVACLINELVGKTLFKSTMLFGLDHPFRIEYGAKNMFAVMLCTGRVPKQLLFFDDIKHELAREPGVKYVQVVPYTYKTPLVPIAKMFLEVFEESGDIVNIELAKNQWACLRSLDALIDSSIMSWAKECVADRGLFEHLNMEMAHNAPIFDTTSWEIGRSVIEYGRKKPILPIIHTKRSLHRSRKVRNLRITL